MNRFADQLRRGLARAAASAAEPITYSRGSHCATINAMRGTKRSEDADTGRKSSVQAILHDWIVQVAQLNLTSGPIEPTEGDIIVDASGVRYRVSKSPADGKCSRLMPFGVGVRIHTVIVQGER